MNKLERKEGVYYTQNVAELPIEERVFFREGVGVSMTLENYREATAAEIAAWEEYKGKEVSGGGGSVSDDSELDATFNSGYIYTENKAEGEVLSLTVQPHDILSYAIVDVSGYAYARITAKGDRLYYTYVFLDANNTIISYNVSGSLADEKVMIPEGAVTLVVNNKNLAIENPSVKIVSTISSRLDNIAQQIVGKQDSLVSGTNIKTINGESLLGEGDITIEGGGNVSVDTELSDTSTNPVENKVVTENINLVYGALKTLYESAGAIYNDTDTDIDRTVTIPSDTTYGEEQEFALFEYDEKGNLVLDEEGNPIKIKHKAGHWFLNGIGDITWEEMAKIYTQGNWSVTDVVTGNMSGRFGGRTNLPPLYFADTYYKTFTMMQSFNASNMLVAWLGYYQKDLKNPTHKGHNLSISNMTYFGQSSDIKRVVGLIDASKWTVAPNFSGGKLEYITIRNLKTNITILSPVFSKESLIYMITYSTATSAITINLRAAVYNKCVEGGEWYADVEAALKNKYGDGERFITFQEYVPKT